MKKYIFFFVAGIIYFGMLCSVSLENLENQKSSYINKILQNRKSDIDSEIEKLSKKIDAHQNLSPEFIEKIEHQMETQKGKCLTEEFVLFTGIETKLNKLKKEIELAQKRKSIIIDTNILIEEPKIIEVIGENQTIIFSGKVIDELDYLKTKPELKEKAVNAIRNIQKHQQDKNIRFNMSRVENLPDDFNKKSPDNKILSVAIQYKKRNPVILTDDKGMAIKAKALDIPAMTINELKVLLDLSHSLKINGNKKKNHKTKRRK